MNKHTQPRAPEASDRLNQYLREYRANHPDTILRWRINSAVNLLTRHGWTLISAENAGDVLANKGKALIPPTEGGERYV